MGSSPTGDRLNMTYSDFPTTSPVYMPSYSKKSKVSKSETKVSYSKASYSKASYSKASYSKKSYSKASYSKKSKSDKSSDECIVCSNNPSKRMLMKAKGGCEDYGKLQAKCNKHQKWIKRKYCQLSCYLDGNGYEGDVCCLNEEEEI